MLSILAAFGLFDFVSVLLEEIADAKPYA